MIRTIAAMGTTVSIEVDAPESTVAQAFEWFRQVEAVCSRFDASSELRQLPVGVATGVMTGGVFVTTGGGATFSRVTIISWSRCVVTVLVSCL